MLKDFNKVLVNVEINIKINKCCIHAFMLTNEPYCKVLPMNLLRVRTLS